MTAFSMPAVSPTSKILNATVVVTALGYFVDLYDLLLFSVTRTQSLTDIGLSGDALTDAGLYIINMQAVGLIIGGLLWGVVGDKVGRKKGLLGSILTYSLATLGCAFVQTVDQYALLRFIAGVGLAGEVGIGVTLIAESMSKEKRGLGTAAFAMFGIMGCVAAAGMAEFFDWRTCYIVGGIAGLALLVTRSLVMESGMFERTRTESHVRGDIIYLLKRRDLMTRYFFCALAGMPVIMYLGFIVTLSKELSSAMGAASAAKVTVVMAVGYTFMAIGDMLAGLVSQYLQRRRRTIKIFAIATAVVLVVFLLWPTMTPDTYYIFAGILGLTCGFWVLVITMAAEQFGTNVRATVAASIPNMIRGTLILMNLLFAQLKEYGVLFVFSVVATSVLALCVFSLWRLKETFKRDLDYCD